MALFSFVASLYSIVVTLLSIGVASFPVLPGIVGSFGVFMPLSMIFAIVFGHIALGQSKWYAPERGYRGLAAASIVIGYVEVVVLLCILINGINDELMQLH